MNMCGVYAYSCTLGDNTQPQAKMPTTIRKGKGRKKKRNLRILQKNKNGRPKDQKKKFESKKSQEEGNRTK